MLEGCFVFVRSVMLKLFKPQHAVAMAFCLLTFVFKQAHFRDVDHSEEFRH